MISKVAGNHERILDRKDVAGLFYEVGVRKHTQSM